MNINKIYNMDCLDGMKQMDDNSVDTVITDPPYGLNFMGKKWDYDIPSIEIWKECLRVLKPGGFLLSFAGTRTQHRMACNIEDAGFEIRDMICWIYGCLSEDTEILTLNGWKHYNKLNQLNIEQPILIYDLKNDIYKWEIPEKWNEYKINDTCYRIKSDSTDQLVSRNHRCLVEREGKLIFKYAETLECKENIPFLESLPTLPTTISDIYKTQKYNITESKITKIKYSGMIFCPTVSTGCFVARRNGKIFITGNSGFPKGQNIGKSVDKKLGNKREIIGVSTGKGYSSQQEKNLEHGYRPYKKGLPHEHADKNLTKGNSEWEGYGTALKPAMEPITIAMKPFKGTFAENALEFGVAGLNIDGARIPLNGEKPKGSGNPAINTNCYGDYKTKVKSETPPQGRYPANVILDEESARLLDQQAPRTGQLASTTGDEPSVTKLNQIYGDYRGYANASKPRDKLAGASRFFYTAKASKTERNMGCKGLDEKEDTKQFNEGMEGRLRSDGTLIKESIKHTNYHPTVKPVSLIEYLCKLTRPPTGGIVLDPFIGSGTTAIACKYTNRDYIGFEEDPEYYKIAKARIKSVVTIDKWI